MLFRSQSGEPDRTLKWSTQSKRPQRRHLPPSWGANWLPQASHLNVVTPLSGGIVKCALTCRYGARRWRVQATRVSELERRVKTQNAPTQTEKLQHQIQTPAQEQIVALAQDQVPIQGSQTFQRTRLLRYERNRCVRTQRHGLACDQESSELMSLAARRLLTFEVTDRRSGDAAEETYKRRLQAVRVNRWVGRRGYQIFHHGRLVASAKGCLGRCRERA